MSTTTAPPNVDNSAIVQASTPRDIATAMVNDPGLRTAILSAFTGLLSGDKSLLGTKTFWAALITPVVGTIVSRYFVGLDDATVAGIDTFLEMAAMVGMRYITKTPVTGIVTPASKQ